MDRTTFAGLTVLTPALSWFIEFDNIKYKTTQAAGTALAASLFQPVSDKFAPRPIHILLLAVQASALAKRLPDLHGLGASGFTNIAPAAKWEISLLPDRFDLINGPQSQIAGSVELTASR